MIDHNLPSDWRDLETKVAEILKECGFETEVEKDVPTTRGVDNIDVFAVDRSQSPEIVYLCECKYWSTAVPQTIVHAFRTVMADYGAHLGLVISKEGFQSGAINAAKNTNITLVNWFEFQQLFEDKWLKIFAEYLYELVVPLVDYSEPVNSAIESKARGLSNEDYEKFRALKSKYFPFASLPIFLKFSSKIHIEGKFKFPIQTDTLGVSEGEVVESYRDLGRFYAKYVPIALEEFDSLFKENVRIGYRRSNIHRMFASLPEILS